MDLANLDPQLMNMARRIARPDPTLTDDVFQEGRLRALVEWDKFDPARCESGEAGHTRFLLWRCKRGMTEMFWRMHDMFPLSETEVRDSGRHCDAEVENRILQIARAGVSIDPTPDLEALDPILAEQERMASFRNRNWRLESSDDTDPLGLIPDETHGNEDDILDRICLQKLVAVWLAKLGARDAKVVSSLNRPG